MFGHYYVFSMLFLTISSEVVVLVILVFCGGDLPGLLSGQVVPVAHCIWVWMVASELV